MATVSAARHRRTPARRLAAERLLAVDGAWLLCFGLLAAATIRHPEPTAILCGICGITGPGVARQGARCAARLWDARTRNAPAAQRSRAEPPEWERDRDADPAGRPGTRR
jgi:hypothetical protein